MTSGTPQQDERAHAANEGGRTTVSVALASFNGARFIDEQLASLAAQTRPPDQLVVSDDASDDDTCERVERFGESVPFEVQLVRNSERARTTMNFERAISRCDRDIVFFSDQDDVWRPEKIERMVAHFDAHPGTGGLFCNGGVVDDDRRPLGYDLWRSQGFHPGEQRMVHRGDAALVFLRHVVAAGNTFAFRGRYLPLLLPFPRLRSVHDAWVAFMVAAVSDFDIMDEDLVEYRLHEENQFGLALLDVRAQIEKARLQISERAFDHAVQLFGEVSRRLDAHPEYVVDPALRRHIEAKVTHSRVRDEMPHGFFARLGPIVREATRGHYTHYGYGVKSLLQDLFLR
ncbi:MAG: glycosyltransferase [Actinomycetota bacterium]|nr:glycosyltransferase [Actinomycetota bacterium]